MTASLRLPGVCIVCRRPVWMTTQYTVRKSWREGVGRHSVRHVCPTDREVCGVPMRYALERCARRPGHTTEHRSRYSLDNQNYRKQARRAA